MFLTRILTCVCLPVIASVASAQDGFVLFGDQDDASGDQAHGFVAPITAPYFHEDSFVTSDVRAWFIHHEFPQTGILGGGDAQVGALQLRVALTEELQFLAYKDGITNFDSDAVDERGANDVAAGIKWNFFADTESQTWISAGVGYEVALGDDDVLQDDDEFRLWVSANQGVDDLHLGAVVNVFFADDSRDGLGNSDRLSWHLHGDYRVNEWFSPVAEVNGYHVISEGLEVLPFQGVDVANLGGGKGENVITLGLGAEVRASEQLAFRAAFERPLTTNLDLFGERLTLSAVFRF